MAERERRFILAISIDPAVQTENPAWKQPLAEPLRYERLAAVAEEAGFAYLAVTDSAEAASEEDDEAVQPSSALQEPRLSALELLAYLSSATHRIGLAAVLSTVYNKPFHIARGLASLDYLSGGRAAWTVNGTASQTEMYNVTGERLPAPELQQARSESFALLVRELWDSWEDGAIVGDKAAGKYIDGDKVHYIHHSDAFFSVRGPLNVPRPPQGHLVIIRNAEDVLADTAAAPLADIVIVAVQAKEEAHRIRAAIEERGAVAEDGSRPLVLAEVIVKLERDIAGAATDSAANSGFPVIAGTAEQIVLQLAQWYEEGACDGFQLRVPSVHQELALFTAEVAPLLRKRGLWGESAAEGTLREQLGLNRPVNPFAKILDTHAAAP